MYDVRMSLQRITVNFTPRTVVALAAAMEQSGDSQTDTINHAVQMYAFFMGTINEGKTIILEDEDGTRNIIEFI